MKIDARRLIHDLGGQSEVRRKLADAGHVITKSGLEKWCIRGGIPSDWMIRLSEISEFKLVDYKIVSKKRKAA